VDAGIGALVGAGIVLFEWKLRTVSLKRLIGAAIGSLLGICGAYLFSLVIRSSVPPGKGKSAGNPAETVHPRSGRRQRRPR